MYSIAIQLASKLFTILLCLTKNHYLSMRRYKILKAYSPLYKYIKTSSLLQYIIHQYSYRIFPMLCIYTESCFGDLSFPQ